MSQIPVYGLSGVEGCRRPSLGEVCGHYTPRSSGRAFDLYASKIKNSRYKQAVINRHNRELAGLAGVFDECARNISAGRGSAVDTLNMKKVKILLLLNDNDFNAYRLAREMMPYVVHIDENGDYYFPSAEMAQGAQEIEKRFFDYVESPAATEYGIEQQLGLAGNFFKKLWNVTKNATKAIGKAVAKSVTVPVKAAVKATKAAYNVTKAGFQAIGGNTSGARASLKKSWENMKESAIDPLKEGVNIAKDLTKYTLVDPLVYTVKTTRDVFRSSVKIMGKVFKVIFLKINPITVAMRGALRAVIGINFLGMASRLNVGLMTAEQAAAKGYSKQAWEDAKKGVEKTIKIFKMMGGKEEKILKSIVKGASKKPLFKKDIPNNAKINVPDEASDEEASLGMEPATATMIASIIGLITVIWSTISKVVIAKKEAAAAEAAAEDEQRKREEQQKTLQTMYDTYAHDAAGNFYTDEYGNLMTHEQYAEYLKQQQEDEEKRKKVLIGCAIAAGGLMLLMLNKSKK